MSYQITKTNNRLFIFGCYSELPEEIFQNVGLTHLRIEGNCEECLHELTPKISKFINLESLIVVKTALRELPNEIVKLRNLKELRVVNCNKFKCLPNEIGKLKNLEILDVWRSGINKLPESIMELSSLKELVIGRNQISIEQREWILEKLSHVEHKYVE